MKLVFIAPQTTDKDCDIWGNFRINPTQIIEERHGEDFVKILLYRRADTYIYGLPNNCTPHPVHST